MNSDNHPSSARKLLVIRSFKNLFGSDPEVDELFALLKTYIGAEPERVQLAILKLSEGDPGETAFPLKFMWQAQLAT